MQKIERAVTKEEIFDKYDIDFHNCGYEYEKRPNCHEDDSLYHCFFKSDKRIKLAVTMINLHGYIDDGLAIEESLPCVKNDSLAERPRRRRVDKILPSFFKAGGYQANGFFSWCYILLWENLIITSKEIKIVDNNIKFINASRYKRTCFANNVYIWDKKEVDSSGIFLSLNENTISQISLVCDEWDEMFHFKSGRIILNKGDGKNPLNFAKHAHGVYCDGPEFETPDLLAEISSCWQYPIKCEDYTQWAIGQIEGC